MFLVSFAGVNYRRRCLARLRLRFSCFARFKTSPFATCPLGCRPCARPLTFAVVVFVRTLPSLTGNRCGHPCLRPSTRPLVMLDLILFRHCGHVYVCFSPALATTLPSFTVNWCMHPCLRPSTRPFVTLDLTVFRQCGQQYVCCALSPATT